LAFSEYQFQRKEELLLVVSLHELVDTSCSVDQILFTSVKRMRHGRNFQFVQRVLVAIFPNNGFFGVYTTVYQETVVTAHVFEYNFAII
jgi:hypothetical protein